MKQDKPIFDAVNQAEAANFLSRMNQLGFAVTLLGKPVTLPDLLSPRETLHASTDPRLQEYLETTGADGVLVLGTRVKDRGEKDGDQLTLGVTVLLYRLSPIPRWRRLLHLELPFAHQLLVQFPARA